MKETIANTLLKNNIALPSYNRDALTTRIVHIGFGAFHRAHQALFTHELLTKNMSDWGICEVNLFGGQDLITQLRQQDHMYAVAEKGAESTEVKIIGSVKESLHPEFDGVETVLEKMAEPQVAIISLTITEKGYCADPTTGALDKTHPLILHDLENIEAPKSAIGYIIQALKLRRQRHLPAFSVLSCDNVQGNGHVAKTVVLEFARMLDRDLASWIETNVSFPCTMVDRIVPAVTPETLQEIASILGIKDKCAVACEPFRQWVIEDNFVAGRPDWDLVGAEFVSDVVPYEEMKLRMLNGCHSFLAYLGYLSGYDHISDTMRNLGFRQAAFDMMIKSQAPSLNMPEGTDLRTYATLLIERFSNPNLKHKTWQIAMDGSQKIPQRLGGSLKHHLAQGSDLSYIATAIAGWMRYVSGIDEKGNVIDVRDPKAEQLKCLCDKHGFNTSVVHELLSIKTIFTPDIGNNPQVIKAVSQAYQSLIDNGAQATVDSL